MTEPVLCATYWYAPTVKWVTRYRAEMSAQRLGLRIEGDELAEYELKP